MTPVINATKTAPVARTAEAEQLLRDAARPATAPVASAERTGAPLGV